VSRALLIVGIALGRAVQAQQPVDSASLFPRIESLVAADTQAQHIPGVALAFVANGRVLYARGFGYANLERKTTVTPVTLFRLGSLSKPVTALAVIAEARARKIPLDAPIGKYLPTLAPSVGRVTLHQLLTHTAGLREIITATPLADRPDPRELVGQLREWSDTMFFADPGEVTSYSNPGFVLAGAFIEAVSGKPFADIVNDRVWRPLGITDATPSSVEAVKHPYADGYIVGANRPAQLVWPIKTDARDLPPTMLWASVLDMARLQIALLNHGRVDGGQALDSAVVDLAIAPHALKTGARDEWYGYGFDVVDHPRGRRVYKGGRIEGYQSGFDMVPSLGIGFVIVANGFDALPRTVIRELVSAEAGRRDVPNPVPIANPTWDARELAGHYVNGSWSLDIADSAGVLTLRGRTNPQTNTPVVRRVVVTGEDRVELVPVSDVGPRTAIPVAVVRGRDGRVKYLYLGDRALRKD
jgi:CubicO group peptidase (beta-lactamase class C family)